MAAINIVLVTHYFSTHRGGVELVAAQLAERLTQDEHFTITWIASDCDPLPPQSPRLTAHPVRCWNMLERFGLPWPIWTWGALCALRHAVRRADAIHLHDFIYFGNIAAFFFARLYGKPVIITQHIGDTPYRSRLMACTLKIINRTLGRYMLSRAKQVVFISEEIRRQFAAYTRFTREPLLLPNGVDTGIFHPLPAHERDALREQLGVNADQPVFLFVGRFVAMKGLTLLRQLAEAMPEAIWWFAGWGPVHSPLHPATWPLANVRVFDDRSGKTLADCYRAADLLLLPSHSEGFPLVVQEALACGTPALVSPEAAIGAPAAHSKLFICPIEPRKAAFTLWKSALHDIIRSGQLKQQQNHLPAFAHQEWAWDSCVAHYARVFTNR